MDEAEVNGVFVYGTLMRGECRAKHIEPHRPTLWTTAQISGFQMLHLGEYPALIPSSDSALIVHGEYVEVANLESMIRALDEVEWYYPDRPEASEYIRKKVKVEAPINKTAWTYVSARSNPHPLIPSNCWRSSQGIRDQILTKILQSHMDRQDAGLRLIQFLNNEVSELELASISGKYAVNPFAFEE